MWNYARLALLAALLSSCSVMAVKRHEPNFRSTREVTKIKGPFHVEAVAGANEEMNKRLAATALTCRLAAVNMPANNTVSAYLKQAFNDELDAAGKLAEKGTPIVVTVKKLESNTGIGKGDWTLDLDYSVKGKVYNVKTTTEFEGAYAGDTACRNTGAALTDAVGENFVKFTQQLK